MSIEMLIGGAEAYTSLVEVAGAPNVDTPQSFMTDTIFTALTPLLMSSGIPVWPELYDA